MNASPMQVVCLPLMIGGLEGSEKLKKTKHRSSTVILSLQVSFTEKNHGEKGSGGVIVSYFSVTVQRHAMSSFDTI
jgi:hypothetical protein